MKIRHIKNNFKLVIVTFSLFFFSALLTAGEVVKTIPGAQKIRHRDYILQYSEKHEQAYYVAYILTAQELTEQPTGTVHLEWIRWLKQVPPQVMIIQTRDTTAAI
jgi:hypothetical protein